MPVIEINNVHRIFENGPVLSHVLRGVSLTVEKGEFVAIMGPSGSGKSTLMNILGLLDTPTTGTYRLEGVDVSTLSDDDLSFVRGQRIGFVFQSFNLLPRAAVLRNVMLPLVYGDVPRREREPRAVAALTAVDLPVDHFDHQVNELSGGQMQRVAIARALVCDPAIILADEPTGNLDSATGEMVMQTFERLRDRGKTIVLITHDPNVAARADRALHILDGRLAEGAFVSEGRVGGTLGAPVAIAAAGAAGPGVAQAAGAVAAGSQVGIASMAAIPLSPTDFSAVAAAPAPATSATASAAATPARTRSINLPEV